MRRVLAVIGVGVALAFAGCGGDDEEEPTGAGTATQEESGAGSAASGQGTPEPQATEAPTEEGAQTASQGKELFTTTCGGCHTLADAGTNGQVGPVLDEVQPSKEEVANAIQQGPGQMPDGLLSGDDADVVAEYVSSVAGQS